MINNMSFANPNYKYQIIKKFRNWMHSFIIYNLKFKIPKRMYASAGFTLLFSVLLTSMLLAVGLAILNITTKQIVLTSFGKESLYAFFAADSGIECARYWDEAVTPSKFDYSVGATQSDIQCNGMDVTDANGVAILVGGINGNDGGNPSDNFAISEFRFTLAGNSPIATPYYVIVQVEKNIIDGATVIRSRGYNSSAAGARTVERGLKLEY